MAVLFGYCTSRHWLPGVFFLKCAELFQRFISGRASVNLPADILTRSSGCLAAPCNLLSMGYRAWTGLNPTNLHDFLILRPQREIKHQRLFKGSARLAWQAPSQSGSALELSWLISLVICGSLHCSSAWGSWNTHMMYLCSPIQKLQSASLIRRLDLTKVECNNYFRGLDGALSMWITLLITNFGYYKKKNWVPLAVWHLWSLLYHTLTNFSCFVNVNVSCVLPSFPLALLCLLKTLNLPKNAVCTLYIVSSTFCLPSNNMHQRVLVSSLLHWFLTTPHKCSSSLTLVLERSF